VLTSCNDISSPLVEMTEDFWSSPVFIGDDNNNGVGSVGFRFVSGPLSDVAGRQILLPAPALGGPDTPPDFLFSFGIWSCWLSEKHGFVASNASMNMVYAPSEDMDGEEVGVIIYNALHDTELLVTDAGVHQSPYYDSQGFFEMMCERGGCECNGTQLHDSTFPWQVASIHQNLVGSEINNVGAAQRLHNTMLNAENLDEDFNVAWQCDNDGQSVWCVAVPPPS
jgi:hypothetical protein